MYICYVYFIPITFYQYHTEEHNVIRITQSIFMILYFVPHLEACYHIANPIRSNVLLVNHSYTCSYYVRIEFASNEAI